MRACREVHVKLARGSLSFSLQAVVVSDLDCDILAGVPFMRDNDIQLDIPHNCIIIQGKHKIPYNPGPTPRLEVRRTQSFLLRSPTHETLFPGDFLEVEAPHEFSDFTNIAVEPRYDSHSNSWIQPDITSAVDGKICIINSSPNMVAVCKHQHIAQAHYLTEGHHLHNINYSSTDCPGLLQNPQATYNLHCNSIAIDPDNQLSHDDRSRFRRLHKQYNEVFNKRIDKYNDYSGRVRAFINMGPVDPPPVKARLPSYNTEKLRLLQEKMDELEDLGVLAKPEDVGVKVEYVSPSFLVKKGDHDFRLVTAFNTIGTYAKPSPSRTTTTDDVFCFLTQHKYIIKTDMTKQFFQLPMQKSSLKYLGVITPFKGLRVYTRAAMGMPGEHLDELMSRVIGDLMHAGKVIKIADDLYTGGNSIDELLLNWEHILQRFLKNNLRLSATKTVVCPVTTTILGWVWSSGRIQASPHRITPLLKSPLPRTVKALRSWCGAFKHLKACIPQYSHLLSPLETATAGQDSSSIVNWTEELSSHFSAAQKSLNDIKAIVIPSPSDILI